jgi:hypothetical protein
MNPIDAGCKPEHNVQHPPFHLPGKKDGCCTKGSQAPGEDPGKQRLENGAELGKPLKHVCSNHIRQE